MLSALLVAIVFGLIAGFVASLFDKLKPNAPYIGLAVAALVFIVKIGLFPDL